MAWKYRSDRKSDVLKTSIFRLYLPAKLRFSGKYLFQEHQISARQLSANSSSTETHGCLNRKSRAHNLIV